VTESWGGAGGGWGNPVVGSTALRIPAINSPNFNLANPAASPTPSWAILQSGLAYFFGLTLTGGTITGPDYIINTSGIFFYSGTPALGNLTGSWTSAAGTDAFGNSYQKDLTVYGTGGSTISLANLSGQPTLDMVPANQTHMTTIPSLAALAINAGLVNEFLLVTLQSGQDNSLDNSAVQLFSESNDGSIAATVALVAAGLRVVNVFKTGVQFTQPIVATAGTVANPTLITTDTWHPITLDANWSTLAGQPVPSYMLMPDGFVSLTGAAQFNVNIANTNLNGANPLPAAYRPSTGIFLAGAPGSAGIEVLTTGVIVAAQGPLATVFCNFNGRYPRNL
jgi:hypothetical protein